MGACCGGMKNSQQHKSLPDKNKAAAAAATANNEQQQQQHQNGNDVTSSASAVDNAKSTGCNDNDDNQQPVQGADNAQFEAAITTLAESLECCPPPVAQQEIAAADNHIKPDESEMLRIEEEPKVEVAAEANIVFAEPPAAPAADVVPEPAAGDEATSGDDAGFEIVSEETVQLRISEDGDLEKQASVVLEVQPTPPTSQEETQRLTDEQPTAAAVETSAEVSEPTDFHPAPVELKLSEDASSSPVQAAPIQVVEPEVSSDVRVADVTADVVIVPAEAPVDNSAAEVTEVIDAAGSTNLESVPPQPEVAVVDDVSVQSESSVSVPSPDIKTTEEPETERLPEITVSAGIEVSEQPTELPATEVKDLPPALESEPVASPPADDQPDNSQQITLSAADDFVKSETEPKNEEPSAVSISSAYESAATAAPAAEGEATVVRSDDGVAAELQKHDAPSSDVKPEQPELLSTVAEDFTKPVEQEQEPAAVEQADLVAVDEVSEQPPQEPAVDSTEPQQQETQPLEQLPSTEVSVPVDENTLPTVEVVPEQVDEISTAATEPQISPADESSKTGEQEQPADDSSLSLTATSEQVDSAGAVEAPETLSDLPPPEPELQQPAVEVVTTEQAAESAGVDATEGDVQQPPSSDVETPATAAAAVVDDGIQSETQHAEPTATIVTESGDLPPPVPDLLSSPSEVTDNADSFPPPPPAEDSVELDHPAASTVDDSVSAVSETAKVNGASSTISPSDDSTESSSTSGLNEESDTAAMKAAAAVDLIGVDGQHSTMGDAVTSEA